MDTNQIDFLKLFTIAYLFLKKSKKLLLSFLILGLIAGAIKTNFTKEAYETTHRVIVGPKNLYIGLLEKINIQLKLKNYETVAKQFNAKPEDVINIEEIEIIRYTIEGADKTKFEQNEFDIILRYKEDSIVLNHSIDWLEYIAVTNPYLKEVYDLEILEKKLLIQRYDNELQKLDSLQSVQPALNSGQIILENKTEIQKQKLELYKTKIKTEAALQLTRPFICIDSFNEQHRLRNFKNLVIFPILSLFVGLFLALGIQSLRKLKAEAEKSEN